MTGIAYTFCMRLHFISRQTKATRSYIEASLPRQTGILEKITSSTMAPSSTALQPILDLRKAHPGGTYFTYSVSAVLVPEHRLPGELFDSVERCLYDAGIALQHYFDGVQIRYDGISLGTYSVSRLVNDPLGLFDDLLQRLIATFRMRTRSHVSTSRAPTRSVDTMAARPTEPLTGDRHDLKSSFGLTVEE